MAVKPVPEGYHTITPALSIEGAADAIEFYKRAFGAQERHRTPMPDGKIAHAEIQIGDSVIMVADPFEQGTAKSPKQIGGTTVSIWMYVEDVDAVFKQAVDAGATAEVQPEDMFWGDRFGSVIDPYGHNWQIATHVEDVTPEEMEKRSEKALAAMS